MKCAIRLGLALLACGVILCGAGRANENDASVSDGPSRAELFEARARADMGSSFNPQSAAVQRPFLIPNDALGDAIYGIDVSHHIDENCVCKAGEKCNLCKINWSRVSAQKITFVYAKATQGTRFKDPTFDFHWRTLAQYKIPRGAYHFMSADEDPLDQADYFIEKLEAQGKLTGADLPPCLNLEADYRKDDAKKWIVVSESGEKLDFWKGQDPDEILGNILKFLRRVEEKTGRTPVIYTSRGWWNDRIKDEKKFAMLKRYPVWIANYPESGRPPFDSPKVPNAQAWALWHFTENGKINDAAIMPGNLDVSVFRGTLVKFRQTLGITVFEPPVVAKVDEPKETSKPAQQVASLTPNQATDANNAPASAAQTQPQDASKPEPTPSTNPTPPAADVNKPAPQTAAPNSNPPVQANTPAAQAPAANPTQATQANKPPQPAAAGSNPPGDANKPSQQVAGLNPSQPAEANKPSPPAVVVVPPSPPAADKAAEQTASINPAESKGSANPSDQQPKVNPAGSTENSSARARAAAQKAASDKTASERIPVEKTAAEKSSGDRLMLEIVLANGRVLRVDASIDPAVLAKIVAALEAK